MDDLVLIKWKYSRLQCMRLCKDVFRVLVANSALLAEHGLSDAPITHKLIDCLRELRKINIAPNVGSSFHLAPMSVQPARHKFTYAAQKAHHNSQRY